MFKRANKITALLVAAASIMSVVPAMAATKLGTKDGTIEDAVAFKDGKYLYQGYRTEGDDTGLYYNAGDKDKKLDSADTIDPTYGKYDNNEVAALDGSNEYLVDLNKGTISDDDTVSDYQSTALTKLQNKLDKTDRYGKNLGSARNYSFDPIQDNRFGDVWYAYSATTQSGATVTDTTYNTTSGAVSYSGYTNQSGAYIDCSKNANIYVYNGYKMVKLENLGDSDTYQASSTTSAQVTLDSIQYVRTLGQDKDYIYRVVKVHVTGAKFVDAVSAAKDGITDSETLYYVQKISKAQGDTEKDAYLPKTTESYLIGKYLGDGDVSDAYGCLVTNSEVGAAGTLTYIVDGSIYTTFRENSEKVKTTRVDLKTSTKLEVNGSSSNKVDGHVAIKNGDKDQKVEGDSSWFKSYAVDVNGNVWAIKDGEILESTKLGDFKTVYTTDRSFDSLDVYDENSLIAWQNGGDAYTTVTEGTKQAQDDASTIVNPTPAKVGWDKQADGTWNFYDATGAKVANNWVNVGGAWYFLKADGVMATGWQQVGGTWYYLNGSGAMATGWVNDNGTWYYLQSSGAMATGWLNDNGTWYYLNASGAMLANTTVDGYVLGASGAWIK
ncbi:MULTISPECIES: N-acetylmuramoyl-L-alanine amidase family protein [unclassified Clostridium]|uniref:N-acetylmuramoyl-L-alanine amidase family protein n=1 Tax=unclassified Clostridium TaxID=2614128 RepID=UPI000297F9E8|nr:MULTISPECIES: N-acetylmuramoyl-L-alanine amidase family protein [unclassified Clostridium]EKQ50547.1 MAG: putative cell wall binding protein [Clostridium sp. Maddingley MBC34-26]